MDKDIVIRVCTGTGGVAAGGEEVLKAIKKMVSSAGIEATIAEGCSIHRVGCRGFCSKDVLVDVVIDGKKTTYKHVKPEMVPRLVEEHLVNGI
ncbi:MAG: (2Fe-2S) ferredoxin domain-containing protein, partial [Nitrospirota bacterium]